MAKKPEPTAPKREPKKRGRTTKLTPQVQEGIVTAIRLGNFQDHAALANGISTATFYAWLERGKKERERLEALPNATPKPDETIFVDFLEAIEKAKAEAVLRNVSIIQKAASVGSWQASAWWLERTQHQLYGRKQQVALQGVENGSPIALSVDTKDLEDKVARILELRNDQ